MKKKLLSIILGTVMTVSALAGCAKTTTADNAGQTVQGESRQEDVTGTETEAEAAGTATKVEDTGFVPEQTYTIGYNYFGSGSYALLTLANNSQIVIDAFGNQSIAMDDEFSVEKIIQDIENMIASGVDGLIIWLPAEGLYTQVADLCRNAQIPFVLNDKIPSDPAIINELRENKYFAGAIAPANAVYGEGIARYALEQGFKTCVLAGPSVGDPSDQPRIDAFKAYFEANGGQVMTECHADTSDAAQGQIEDALTAYPDVDFVYGSGSDFGIAACGALQNMGIDAAVLTSGLDAEALNCLEDGTYMKMVSGDFWVCGTLSAIVLQNYLDGTPLKDSDGNAVWIDDVMPFTVSAEQIGLYKQFFLDETCYSAAQLQACSGKYNPDFNYDAFVKLVKEYSLESRLIAKYNEGKITADEMQAAGITAP